jgi:hypothetical protein
MNVRSAATGLTSSQQLNVLFDVGERVAVTRNPAILQDQDLSRALQVRRELTEKILAHALDQFLRQYVS